MREPRHGQRLGRPMKHLLVLIAAASLALPTLAAAQTPPPKQQQGQTAKPGARPAARPATRPATRPSATRPSRPATRPSATRPASTRPAARPSRPSAPAATRPLPPRGGQAYHRGQTITRVHAPAFAYPRGWHYRRWAIGGILPQRFLAQTYWYADWSALGLQAPPPGYEWVRFGPDLILVNLATGAIEDVIYGAFY